ncbi:O-methylsterigmatocystin oxidoreductase [Coprinopsis sp. MPI-PUGE-AT-0042]|nr:O-methylsterigmatocystin oxidoreductase [Coprinopsis sp. MPI-PUGE-AT-0042]
MESLAEAYRQHPFVATSVLVGTLTLLRFSLRRKESTPLPPGPRGYPLIGNVLDIPTEHPWQVYSDWSKKYGDVFYFEALGNKFVVLNSLDAINTLLVERSSNYSDRIKSPIIQLSRHSWSVAFMSYGQQWRDHRRAFHRFFNHKEVHHFHPIIEGEVSVFLRSLLSQPRDFHKITHHFFGSVIMRAAYGADDPEYNKALAADGDGLLARLLEVMTPGKFLVGFLPSMRHIPSWLPSAGWRRALEEFAIWNDRFISVPFEDTKARIRNGTQKSPFRSMAVELIEDLPEEDSPDFKYKEDVVKSSLASAYIAGADTTVSTALSVILALAMYPDVLRKAQEQIDLVVGQDRLPTFGDFENLPYVRAIVKEAGRWHTVVPLAMPHVCRDEDTYNGMRIPAGAMVMPNGWAIMHDPKNFDAPFDFKPERYLKADGQIDPTVLDHESTSFGYGRRLCPGRHLSDDTLMAMTAAFIACFNIKPAEGLEEPLALRIGSNTVSYPLPFECRIEPRSQNHITLINSL